MAQQVQRVEDRYLREQQDREYQEALDMDRRRAEEREAQRRQEEEERRQAEEEQRKAQEEMERQLKLQQELEAKRRSLAAQLQSASGTARLALRLPSGQRVERKFEPTATLQEVYDWASCVAFLPENSDKGIEIPERFVLKTSFPARYLDEMDRTVDELKLSGTNILLAAIEDD